jgi:hypothetical protein
MASTIKVNNIQNQCGANIANKCGTTITLGASGDTITLACGASQTGFGRTGTVDWDTTAKTASFTAVSGNGYFVNTTSGAITVTMPASPSAGDIVSVADYAGTAATNNITIGRNGSNFEGGTVNGGISTNRQTATFVYVDGTQGWVVVDSNDASFVLPQFITATGGTETTCGNYKIHTFTSPGTFCVSCGGNPAGSTSVEYIVVAGGGSGGIGDNVHGGGGGGAGGFRFSSPSLACVTYPAKPLAAPTALPVTAQGYPITIGAGGAANTACTVNPGSNTVFSTITSAGGGGGANENSTASASQAKNGGSGGGAGVDSFSRAAGTGNTPPVSPPQGTDGNQSIPNPTGGYGGAGGGGGAIQPGQQNPLSGPGQAYGGDGGDGGGFPNAFGTSGENCGSYYYFSGGGAGASRSCVPSSATGGLGGGGDANPTTSGTGTTNTGGGGSSTFASAPGGSGGSGIVIIRYKYQ